MPYRNKTLLSDLRVCKNITMIATFQQSHSDNFTSFHARTAHEYLAHISHDLGNISQHDETCVSPWTNPRLKNIHILTPAHTRPDVNYCIRGDQAGSEAKVGVGTCRTFCPVRSTDHRCGPPCAPRTSRKNMSTRPLGAQVGPSL